MPFKGVKKCSDVEKITKNLKNTSDLHSLKQLSQSKLGSST